MTCCAKLLQNNVQNDLYPYYTRLCIETPSAIYFVSAADPTKLYKTTDEGVTVSQVDVDPGDIYGGDNKSRSFNIFSANSKEFIPPTTIMGISTTFLISLAFGTL